MLGKIVVSSTCLSLVVLALLLVKTTPATAGPIGILAVFVLMYSSALGVLTFLIFGASAMAARGASTLRVTKASSPLNFKRSYYYASVVAAAPVMLVAMQSVNELGLYQLSLVVLFVAIAWVYLSKRVN